MSLLVVICAKCTYNSLRYGKYFSTRYEDETILHYIKMIYDAKHRDEYRCLHDFFPANGVPLTLSINRFNLLIMIRISTKKTMFQSVLVLLSLAGFASESPSTADTLKASFPSHNTSPKAPDTSGMRSNAQELAGKIIIGWNLGNSIEAINGETAWGNPPATKALIDLVKQSGFNAVRIPCSWDQYVEDTLTAKIYVEWMDRVREVVDYCVGNNMYVLINIHWDGGWLENNCTVAKQQRNNAKQKAFWEQIATYFRDYDEHLLFAGANEPNVEDSTQMTVLNSYYQTFIDAVRSTGGRNTYRVLVIQGPCTDIEKTHKLMLSLPTDPTPRRMMTEVHFYTPWNFCGLNEDASWGKMFYYWGKDNHSATDPDRNPTWGEEDVIDKYFGMMKTQFVDKGIPVVMGEYAAMRRTKLSGEALERHVASRNYYHKYVTQKMVTNGIIPFYWDNGGVDDNACGLFNRRTITVFDQQTIDALMQGVKTR